MSPNTAATPMETEITWLERLPRDPSLQAFVSAEITRAGLELDSLRWQHDHDRRRIATLIEQLRMARQTITRLRRQRGHQTARLDDDIPDPAGQ